LQGLLANIAPAALDYLGFIDLPSYLEPVLLGIVASIMFTYLGSRGDAITQRRARLFSISSTGLPLRTSAKMQRASPWWHRCFLLLMGASCHFCYYIFMLSLIRSVQGVIAVGESIDWSGLEPWFVLGPLVIHVPLGVVAWRVIRKRYTPEAA
jgi:sodium/pantothenate symporter